MKKPFLIAASIVTLVVALAAASTARAGSTRPGARFDGGVILGPVADVPQGTVNWIDHFDTYATGSQMHGQGGWQGWLNDPTAGALTTTLFDRSAPNSVEVSPTTDLVHPYSGYTAGTGVWTYTAHVYIPTGTTGDLYFIMLNTYPPNQTTFGHWSTQLCFDTGDGLVRDDLTGTCTSAITTTPLILDQWVEIRVVIDLDNDQQTVYYGGQLFYGPVSWSQHLSPTDGSVNIAAVDLFAAPLTGPSPIYFDDLSLSNLAFLDGFESGDTREWHFTQP